MNLISSLILLLFLLFTVNSYSTEMMFRHGYKSCIACHSSVAGGNLLTGYGKLVSNSLSQFKRDESKLHTETPFDYGIKFRLANVTSDASSDTFPMQGDLLTSFQIKKIKLISILAKSPERNQNPSHVKKPNAIETTYFRELKGVYQISDKDFLTMGREYQNIGLFLEDHTSYIKAQNRFNITDLTSITRYNHFGRSLNYGISLFAPNLQEKEETKEYGVKASIEKMYSQASFKLSTLHAKSSTIRRNLLDFTFKLKFKKFLLMGESTLTYRKTSQKVDFKQNAHYLKLSYFPVEFLEFFTTNELIRREYPFFLSEERLGAGIAYKAYTNLTFRIDYKKTFLTKNQSEFYISQLYLNWW